MSFAFYATHFGDQEVGVDMRPEARAKDRERLLMMESYSEAEEIIRLAWGNGDNALHVSNYIDHLIREGKINGNDIIVLVQTALNQKED